MTVKRREDTLEYLGDQGVDDINFQGVLHTAEELTAARVAEARAAERMGHAGSEAKWMRWGSFQPAAWVVRALVLVTWTRSGTGPGSCT